MKDSLDFETDRSSASVKLALQQSSPLKNILLITNVPTPYRIPLFNELNRQLAEKGFQFRVVFAAAGYERRLWEVDLTECDFDHVVLGSKPVSLFGDAERTLFTYTGLGSVIRSYRPSLTIVPGFSLGTARCWFTSLYRRIPYVIWSGSIHRYRRPWSRLRLCQRRLLARGASGGIAYGTKARSHLIELGLPSEKVFVGINTVDTSYYDQCLTARYHQSPNPSRHTLLCLGNLTAGKRLDLVLSALAVLATKRTDFVLKIVGSGPEEDTLRQLAERLGIDEMVRFEGFQPKSEVRDYLAEATCLLFPSEYDVWGLVLNEAMAAGLPCVSSVHAGSTLDLIQNGVTGFSVDFADPERVAERIDWLFDRPEHAARIGKAAASFVREKASIHASARGFVEAVLSITDRSEMSQ